MTARQQHKINALGTLRNQQS